jgi:IS30 family transposase
MHVTHETIYRALYAQADNSLRRELARRLRTGRSIRKQRRQPDRRTPRFSHPMVPISQRPLEAADRAVPGHWEGDRATRSCTNLSGLTDWRGS